MIGLSVEWPFIFLSCVLVSITIKISICGKPMRIYLNDIKVTITLWKHSRYDCKLSFNPLIQHLQTRHWKNHNGYLQIIHFIHSHEKNISRDNVETIMFKLSADIVFPFLFFLKLRLHNYQNIQKWKNLYLYT